jgi:YHS domain-containing protein
VKALSSALLAATCVGAFNHVPVNEKCPLTGKAISEEAGHVTVKFCSEDCREKYESDPVPFLIKVDRLPNEKCPVSGKPIDRNWAFTVAVGFCSEECKETFEKEPVKYLPRIKGPEKKKGK